MLHRVIPPTPQSAPYAAGGSPNSGRLPAGASEIDEEVVKDVLRSLGRTSVSQADLDAIKEMAFNRMRDAQTVPPATTQTGTRPPNLPPVPLHQHHSRESDLEQGDSFEEGVEEDDDDQEGEVEEGSEYEEVDEDEEEAAPLSQPAAVHGHPANYGAVKPGAYPAAAGQRQKGIFHSAAGAAGGAPGSAPATSRYVGGESLDARRRQQLTASREALASDPTPSHLRRFQPYVELEKEILRGSSAGGVKTAAGAAPRTGRLHHDPNGSAEHKENVAPTNPKLTKPHLAVLSKQEQSKLQRELHLRTGSKVYKQDLSVVLNVSRKSTLPTRKHSDPVAAGQRMRTQWKADPFLQQKGRAEDRWRVRLSMLQ